MMEVDRQTAIVRLEILKNQSKHISHSQRGSDLQFEISCLLCLFVIGDGSWRTDSDGESWNFQRSAV